MSAPSGLTILYDRLTPEAEAAVIQYVDSQPWSTELSRRTQHYGVAYNYQSRNLQVAPAPPMAGSVQVLAQWLTDSSVLEPHQCIINEYYRDQGIAPHIDREVFGDTVAGVSVGADAVMEFTRGSETYSAWLPRRSLMIMTGEARYEWKHSIPERVRYQDPTGATITKPSEYRRISLTYRRVL